MNLRTPLVLLLCFVALLPLSLFAQDDEPSQAPTTDLFSLESDQVGLFQNSVNLFTGEVAFSLPLVNLPGRGGLNAGVSIAYSSAGVGAQVESWNLEAPTGTLGLGWQIEVPKVVVDHKSTGTRIDDDFYLIENGASNPLIVVKKEDGIRYFASTNYKFWDIRYEEASETWTIIKEDGTTFIYGDQNSERQTVQHLVKWGNWIGSSSETSGQTRQAMQWDLSEIRNIYGDAVTFSYQQVLQKVGGDSGKEHTEASYLFEIKNPQGQVILFDHRDRKDAEFQEPHTEKREPDAYQERYERKYLYAIEMRQDTSEPKARYRVEFGYVLSGSRNFTKRLLTSIRKTDGDNKGLLPPIEFAYAPTGERKECLEVVTTSQGPQIEYTYGSVAIDGSERDLLIEAPEGYSEPQTWMGNNYVVVAWRQLNENTSAPIYQRHVGGYRNVKVRVYQWNGRWIEGPETDIADVALKDFSYQNFEVALGKDFFGITYYSQTINDWQATLYHQIDTKNGAWKVKSYPIEGARAKIKAGNDFILLATAHQDNGENVQQKVYTWSGADWQEKVIYDNYNGDFYYTAVNNYFIAHNNDGENGNSTDIVRIHYKDELGQWHSKTLPLDKSYNTGKYDNGGIFKDGDKYEDVASHWHSANGMAVWMADSEPEVIIQWDEDYNLDSNKDAIGGWSDYTPVYMLDNSMIGIWENNTGAGYRFDGKTWHSSGPVSLVRKYTPYQNDLFFNALDGQNYFQTFNPNTKSWIQNPLEGFGRPIYGNDYAIFGDIGYYRFSDGWKTITIRNDLQKVVEGYSLRYSKHSGRIITRMHQNDDKSDLIIDIIKNGAFSPDNTPFPITLPQQSNRVDGPVLKYGQLVGPDMLITYPDPEGKISFQAYYANATEIALHKLVDGHIKGKQTAYPVTQVTVHSGYQELPTTYVYTTSSAMMAPGGYTAQFNKVTMIPGSIDPAVTPYGYSEQYFFNGLPEAEASLPFPEDNFPAINAANHYQKLLGMPYTVRTFDNQSKQVAESKTKWHVYGKIIKAAGASDYLDRGYYARVNENMQEQDGFTQSTVYYYDQQHTGMPNIISTTNSQGKTQTSIPSYATDFEDDYLGSDLLRERHILSPVLEQVVSLSTNGAGSQTLQKNQTHYALQDATQTDSAPVPVKTVVYPNGEDESYSVTSTYQYDQYGNLLQSQTEGGLVSSYIYGYDYTRPVVEAIEATYAELKAQLDPTTIQDKDGNALRQALDGLRTGLPKAHIATTTYDSFYGNVLSVTDPRGRTTYSTYDQLGRLRVVKDHDGYVRQKVEYSLQK